MPSAAQLGHALGELGLDRGGRGLAVENRRGHGADPFTDGAARRLPSAAVAARARPAISTATSVSATATTSCQLTSPPPRRDHEVEQQRAGELPGDRAQPEHEDAERPHDERQPERVREAHRAAEVEPPVARQRRGQRRERRRRRSGGRRRGSAAARGTDDEVDEARDGRAVGHARDLAVERLLERGRGAGEHDEHARTAA